MKNKKGVMGLDTAKAFMVGLLSLIIIGIVAMVLLTQLNGTALITADTNAGSVTAEIGYINETGYTVAQATATGFASPTLVNLTNYTDGSTIGLGNATISAAGVITNSTVTNWDNVSIDYTYTYETASNTQAVITNATGGLSDFFSNTSVWLSLLGVVIIILIIAAVVAVVNRFGATAVGSESGISM